VTRDVGVPFKVADALVKVLLEAASLRYSRRLWCCFSWKEVHLAESHEIKVLVIFKLQIILGCSIQE
jgi:hypothetical protein